MFNCFEVEKWRAQGSNPATRITTPTERPRLRVLTADEQAGILAALARLGDDAPGRALLLLYETGARLNEIRLLEWEHVDADASELHLAATKTGPQTRVLTDGAKAVLARCHEVSGNPFVFSSRAGSPIGERTIRSRFHKAAQMAGVAGIRPHDFRRTMIVDALESGIPITLVARMAGHSTIAMTSRYAAHETSQVKAAAEQLAAARKVKRGADVHALQFGRGAVMREFDAPAKILSEDMEVHGEILAHPPRSPNLLMKAFIQKADPFKPQLRPWDFPRHNWRKKRTRGFLLQGRGPLGDDGIRRQGRAQAVDGRKGRGIVARPPDREKTTR